MTRKQWFIQNRLVLAILIGLLFWQHCSGVSNAAEANRSPEWAVPVVIEGLPNLHKVSDDLYRGAQPSMEGFVKLKELGIKTIVNLRGSDKDYEHIRGKGFNYFHIPVNTFSPNHKEFARFLEIVSNPAYCPVFVHCKHGADRTGTAAALYRVKIQGWDVEKAIDEMVHGGYHFHWIHWPLKTFIRRF
jgi:protein tyrosine phosphatase (PTP) superfamily phosphohydrolase (DUF442 family)